MFNGQVMRHIGESAPWKRLNMVGWQLEVAGNSPVCGPGWEFPLVVAQGVAGKPSCKPAGRKPYFRYSSQGCIGMTLNSARGQRDLYEWFFDRSCSCGSWFDVDVAFTAATRLPDKITFSVQVC